MDIRARVFSLNLAMDITSDRALPGCKPVPMLLAAPMFRSSDIGDDATQHFSFRNPGGFEPGSALCTEGAPTTGPLALPLPLQRACGKTFFCNI
jgi:hypothetical protein